MHRIIILGNSGSGKSTLAKRLADQHALAILSLDDVAWTNGPTRRPLDDSMRLISEFTQQHSGWVIEGCYGSLIEGLLPQATELFFLNPGVETCLANCRKRAWEPEKFASRAEQDAMLATLLDWVELYDSRDDEFGLHRHRAIFDSFSGPKRECRTNAEVTG